MDKKSRSRSTNFRPEEVDVLLTLIGEFKDIVECKKTDQVTNSAKDSAWEKLTNLFNSQTAGGRSVSNLRSKWDVLKKATRKEYALLKLNNRKTGGGPAECDALSSSGEKVLAIIGLSVTGTSNNFDDDQELEIICGNPNSQNEENIAPENCNETVVRQNEWRSWTPTLLKQPVNEALQLSKPAEATCSFATPKRNIESSKKQGRDKLRTQPEKKVYECLALKKLELIALQMETIKNEAAAKERRDEERHLLEMEVLRRELLIKQKQLDNLK